MAKKNSSSTKPTLPRTLEDDANDLQEKIDGYNALITKARAAVTEMLTKEFEAKGGCKACRGRGWVVTWDTMDSLSGCFAEYGSCREPGCTEESRKRTGLHPAMHEPYDRNRGVKDPVLTSDAYVVLARGAAEALAKVAVELASINEKRRVLRYLDDVVVVRGRKVPTGFTGRICWMGTSEWGARVGIQAASGEKMYTARSNVEKLA